MRKILLVTGILFVLLAGCTIDEPTLPRWVAPFVVPLTSEKIVFSEDVVNDSTIILQGNQLSVRVENSIDPMNIEAADLNLDGVDTTAEYSLKELVVDSVASMSTPDINIVEIFPDLPNLIGQTAQIQQTTVSGPSKELSDGDFKRMNIKEGTVFLELHNELPMVLGPNPTSSGVQVTLYDSLNTQVGSALFDQPIPPGGVGLAQMDLNNLGWIYTPLRIEYTLSVAADTSFTVTQNLLDNSKFWLTATLRNLKVEEILGKLQSQTIQEVFAVDLAGDNQVNLAKISDGQLVYNFANQIPVDVDVSIIIRELHDNAGQSFQDQFTITSQGNFLETINLAGYEIRDAAGGRMDSFHVDILAITRESGGYVNVKASDYIRGDISLSGLQCSRIAGILEKDTVDVDPFEEIDVIDYEGFTSGIEFETASLQIVYQTNASVENLWLNLEITGYHKNDAGVYTDSAKIILQDEPLSASGLNTIIIAGQQVADFLNVLPSDIRGMGNVVYSGNVDIAVGDEFKGNYVLSTPFRLRIVNPEPFEMVPDTLDEEDISQDVQDLTGDEIRDAVLRATVVNHSPLSGEAKLFVSADWQQTDIYDTTTAQPGLYFVKTISLPMATINSSTGLVQSPGSEEISIHLNTPELRLFQNPPLRMGVLFNLDETPGIVVIQGTDFIEVSGQMEVTVLIKEDE
ncbi:MAG: hypothetical protein Kow0037_16650 [Calditrichia bacterium]